MIPGLLLGAKRERRAGKLGQSQAELGNRIREEEGVPGTKGHPKRSNTKFTALLRRHHTATLLRSLCQSEELEANLSQKHCSLPRSLPWTEYG